MCGALFGISVHPPPTLHTAVLGYPSQEAQLFCYPLVRGGLYSWLDLGSSSLQKRWS